MSEKQERKIAGKTLAIALGIICIILAVGLVGAVADYTSIISGKDNTITTDNNTITTDNAQIQTLTNQNNQLNSVVNLSNSTTWLNNYTTSQGNGQYSDFYYTANYAGYVSVYVQSSTVPGTWVEVSYTAYGVTYNQEITVSEGSTAEFPVLPAITTTFSANRITIGVGNGLVMGSGATETVTITYHY